MTNIKAFEKAITYLSSKHLKVEHLRLIARKEATEKRIKLIEAQLKKTPHSEAYWDILCKVFGDPA